MKMLKSRNKVVLPDSHTARRNDLEIDIIPNKSDLEIKIGDLRTTVKRKDLYSLAFVIGTPEEQVDLVPVKQTTIRKYTKFLKIKARKNIRKGEYIQTTVDFNVPIEVYEGIRKDIFEKEKRLVK